VLIINTLYGINVFATGYCHRENGKYMTNTRYLMTGCRTLAKRNPWLLYLFFSVTILLPGTNGTAATSGLLDLKSIASKYDFPPPFQSGSNIFFTGKYTSMIFEIDSRKLFFNNILIWLNNPVVKTNETCLLSKYDSDVTIDSLMRLNQKRAITNRLTIVLDPGHGGKDTGAIGPHKSCEKKIVMDIANSIKNKLESSQFSVVLTRKWDTALTRAERVAEARRNKANLFVSIHVNSAPNLEASGIETFILPGPGFSSTSGKSQDNKASSGNRFDNINIQLAYCMHRQMLALTGAVDRGIRRARFDVLMEAPCPAALIECGFVSNSKEEAKLIKKAYRETLAEGIANGIRNLVHQQ